MSSCRRQCPWERGHGGLTGRCARGRPSISLSRAVPPLPSLPLYASQQAGGEGALDCVFLRAGKGKGQLESTQVAWGAATPPRTSDSRRSAGSRSRSPASLQAGHGLRPPLPPAQRPPAPAPAPAPPPPLRYRRKARPEGPCPLRDCGGRDKQDGKQLHIVSRQRCWAASAWGGHNSPTLQQAR